MCLSQFSMTRFQLKHWHASSKEAYSLNNLLNPRGDKDIHVKIPLQYKCTSDLTSFVKPTVYQEA